MFKAGGRLVALPPWARSRGLAGLRVHPCLGGNNLTDVIGTCTGASSSNATYEKRCCIVSVNWDDGGDWLLAYSNTYQEAESNTWTTHSLVTAEDIFEDEQRGNSLKVKTMNITVCMHNFRI